SSFAHAMIDVSDGVGSEASHIAKASGVRLELDASALEEACSPALLHTCVSLRQRPLELMLFGGEDYALLATGPSRHRPDFASAIGAVTKGDGAWLRRD